MSDLWVWIQRAGQRADHERFGQPRHPFEQGMPSRKDRDQDLLDHGVLPDDHLRELVAELVVGLLAALNRGDIVGRRGQVAHAQSFLKVANPG